MKYSINDKAFKQDMKNIMDYAIGFIDGINGGKKQFLNSVGVASIETMKEFIDSYARTNPEVLHHVYEWMETGSPNARLYDLSFTISNLGISIKSNFTQSTSVKSGSKFPFADKARVMENGISVTVKPKTSPVLAFEVDGEKVFTSSPVTINNPGGTAVEGGFEKVFDLFMNRYFAQSFLHVSGISNYLQNPEVFKRNLPAGKRGGKSVGVKTGYRWIANAGVVK